MRLITSPMTAIAVLVASTALLIACGGGDDSEADAATSTPTAQPTSKSGELIPTATPFASRPTPTIVSTESGGGGGGTAATPAATAAPQSSSSTHVVAEGDTLSAIAEQYGVTIEAIMEANSIEDAALIFVGQELTIPATSSGSDGSGSTPESAGRTHVVVEGDTLSGIADQYGVTIEAISEANGLTDSVIFLGQELSIPDAPEATPTPEATATPEATSTDGGSGTTYTVADGDTATDIATAFGVTLQALADANDTTIEGLNNLQVGQVLNIPVSGE